MRQHYLTFIFALCSIISISAQEEFKATILDSTSQNPVPFATITFNNSYGVISNDTGQFLIHLNTNISETDSLFVSCLGFESKQIALQKFNDSLIYLQPKTFELNEVVVTKENYTADEIIDLVKENLTNNYETNHTQRKLFFRESYTTKVEKSDIDIKKSTIPEFNQQFIDSLLFAIPKKSDAYTEILGTMYGQVQVEKPQKLDIIKASRLYDKNNEISFEAFEERINSVIRKRVKRDSYFKIKSGLFGTKEEMDTAFYDNKEAEETVKLIEDQKKKEQEQRNNFLRHRKSTIAQLEQNSCIFEDTDLNFIVKSNKYRFELLDYAFLNNNYVYKINFSPKRSAKYSGTLYINPQNFAIERVDYQNVKSLKDFGLLGISFDQYLHRGTLIYGRNENEKYALKFAEMEDGTKFGIKRPLTIIEKNKHVKGRRKQNEISGKLHFIISNVTKKQLVHFENKPIDEITYKEFKENPKVKPTYLPAYDPEFWKGHNVIEPNAAIKEFKSVE